MVNNIQGAGNSTQSQAVASTQATQQVQISRPDSKEANQQDTKNTDGIANVKEIRNAVEELNLKLESQEIQVNFDVDEESGRIIVMVKDINSGEVIRQIPSEATLEFAHNASKGVGITLDSTF
jgi:flagellar protein FlaG